MSTPLLEPGLAIGVLVPCRDEAQVIERKLAIRRRPAPVPRVWTLTVMLGSSVLFVYPVSQVLLDPRVVGGVRWPSAVPGAAGGSRLGWRCCGPRSSS